MKKPSKAVPLNFFDYMFVIVTFGFILGAFLGIASAAAALSGGSIMSAITTLFLSPILSALFHVVAAAVTYHLYKWVASHQSQHANTQ